MLGLIEGLSTGVSQAAKLNQQQLGLLVFLSHERPASDQIPDNNNQQLLGLIEEFTKEPSETKRPRTIAPSEPPATSHGQPATSSLQF